MGHGDHAGHDMSGHGMKMDTPEAGKPAPASAHDHAAMDHSVTNEDVSADHASMNHAAMDHAAMGHAAPGNASMQMDHSMHGASGANALVSHPASETGNPAVDMPTDRRSAGEGKRVDVRVELGVPRVHQ